MKITKIKKKINIKMNYLLPQNNCNEKKIEIEMKLMIDRK